MGSSSLQFWRLKQIKFEYRGDGGAYGLAGCQRETPVEKSQASQSPSVVDQAVRQSVDAIQTPMDKARGVERTLSDAAGRTADRVQEGTP